MSLGLGSNISKSGLITPGVVTDSILLKHKYDGRSVVPVSDGAAYLADANSDYIAIPEMTLNIDGSNISFAWWGKINDTSNINVPFGKISRSTHSFIMVHSNGSMYIETDTNEDTVNRSLNDHDTNWHHYAIVTNGSGGVTMYQDGITLGTTGNNLDNDMTISCLGLNNSSKGWDGYLCNMAIWSRSITAAEVPSIMNKKYADLTDSEKTNLTSWWNLDSSFSGSVTNDELLVYDNHYNAGTDILGDNVLLDGTFTEDVGESASGTYWTTGAGWTISGGSATYDGGGDSNTQLDSAVNSNIVDGNVYQIKFDLTDTGGGGVYVRLNNTWWSEGGSDIITGTATHTIYARAGTGTNFIEFETGHDDKAFSLDNITIRKVNGNPGVLL